MMLIYKVISRCREVAKSLTADGCRLFLLSLEGKEREEILHINKESIDSNSQKKKREKIIIFAQRLNALTLKCLLPQTFDETNRQLISFILIVMQYHLENYRVEFMNYVCIFC